MSTYRVHTTMVTEREYVVELTLPVDMGASADRLTDRLIRTAVANGTLDLNDAESISEAKEGDEIVAYVVRADKQIWPTPHKKRTPKTMTATDALACKPGEGPDPEDVG